jgi:Na+/melibiose symporter-like transporter
MDGFVGRTQERLVGSFNGLMTLTVKLITGFTLGLTFGLVVLELFGYKAGEGNLALVFTLLVVWGLFWRISRKWSLTGVLVFDLICVLLGLLVRLYVVVAPNL